MTHTIVITGASSGVGAAAARRLKKDGANVVVVGRDADRTNRIADEIDAQCFVADFAKLSDVYALADELNKLDRIDVLANNAGGMVRDRQLTQDGLEFVFGVNHVAPFLLTHLLMDKLIASNAAIINTASTAAYRGHISMSDLELTKGWTPWHAYCNSKLMNILFTRELNQRFTLKGVYPVCFHPGVVSSGFGHIGGVTGWYYASPLGKRLMVTPEQGADTLCWLAEGSAPRDWAPGEFYSDRHRRRLPRQGADAALAVALWNKTERILGL